jgi:transposase InsO family protein
VGTDLFQLKNKDYLIVVDYTSKYFEVSAIPNTLASTVVQHTKSIFARFGIPKIVVSDNGAQYSSHQYKTFAKEWGFQHDTSSPRYPKSNGFVERVIQTVKKTIKKTLKSGDDPCLALLALRSTPGTDNSPSPAFKLMNRNLRTPLPLIKTEKISPTLLGSQKVRVSRSTCKELATS